MAKDIRHALRLFRENPGFTVAAVSALTIGIGLNTAIFSVFNTVLLKPPPFPDPDRLVLFMNTSPGGQGSGASPAKFNHWRAQTSVVQDVSVFRTGVMISPGYFDAFRIPVLRGRAFTDLDNGSGNPVVVINNSMAAKYWPKGNPLADRIWIGKGIMAELAAERPRQIVGVVGDVRDNGLNRDPQPAMYVPAAQVPDALNALNVRLTPQAWIVRSAGNPALLSAAVQEQLRQVSGLPVSDVRTMETVVSRSLSRERFNMLLMSVFGCAALLLAAIGVYGLMSYSVQQRTREIGIRMALGAKAGDVRRMVVLQGFWFALTGVAAGAAAAFGLARFMQTFLFEVKPWDPVVFVAVPVLLTAIARIAVAIPAARATRVDPISALRYE